jgi:hypothetical protein
LNGRPVVAPKRDVGPVEDRADLFDSVVRSRGGDKLSVVGRRDDGRRRCEALERRPGRTAGRGLSGARRTVALHPRSRLFRAVRPGEGCRGDARQGRGEDGQRGSASTASAGGLRDGHHPRDRWHRLADVDLTPTHPTPTDPTGKIALAGDVLDGSGRTVATCG